MPLTDEVIIEQAESTGEGATEGLTLRVRGFPDSAVLGAYLAHGGIRCVPSESGSVQPDWWDLFFAGADAGIAYAPADGISRIEIESSAALAVALPLVTRKGTRVELGGVADVASLRQRLAGEFEVTAPAAGQDSSGPFGLVQHGREVARVRMDAAGGAGVAVFDFAGEDDAGLFHHVALTRGHAGVANAEIAEAIGRYIRRHHRAVHESSHVVRNSILAVAGAVVLVLLVVMANQASGGRLFKTVRGGAVRARLVKDVPAAFVVTETAGLVRAGNIVAIGSVYLEFPERAVRSVGDTVAVAIPELAKGDRIFTAGAARPDSTGGIVQIIVARIVNAAGEVRYEHQAGALPIPSYRLLTTDQWGTTTALASLGPDYAETLEQQVESSKRIRLQGDLVRNADETGAVYAVISGGHKVLLRGPFDALTAARLEQFGDGPVDLCGNVTRIFSGAYANGKPTDAPMLEVNPQGVFPLTGK